MRARILSIVLFPAPLRPITPTTSPALHLVGQIAKRPQRLGTGAIAAAAQRPQGRGHETAQRVAESLVAVTGAQLVEFADAVESDRELGHATPRPRRFFPCSGNTSRR